jgi:hypothetical protein
VVAKYQDRNEDRDWWLCLESPGETRNDGIFRVSIAEALVLVIPGHTIDTYLQIRVKSSQTLCRRLPLLIFYAPKIKVHA